MADIICRWRNGTPSTVVDLVNSMPHEKMTSARFRSFMSSKWQGAFFTSPYQLACQLALYCEAEDGFFYPRFDHDITQDEAQAYLEFWFPRYYVPNPYVGKDGFNNIKCPTYVLHSIYEYVKTHPSTSYQDAYCSIFKETPKNNNDIMCNYINHYSKILKMDKNGVLKITDINSEKIFGFMNRTDKKGYFDSFTEENKSMMNLYINSSFEEKKKLFAAYLRIEKGLSDNSIKYYTEYHLSEPSVLEVIQNITNKPNLYEVIDLFQIQKIWEGCHALEVNLKRRNVFTASVSNYKDFINFLEDENACQLLLKSSNTEKNVSMPASDFSIASLISLINETGLLYTPILIKRFAFSLLSKRFLILSGLAGSGKTQLAIAFASALVENDSQIKIVSVGADWTNREPLLGFPNALQAGSYVTPESEALQLLIEANKPENADKPFFLILDEMNMSYVERYFADFLSSMESHKPISLWNGSDDSDVPSKVSLPKNLFIIGTINVDETTYMFSPKVLDRANVIEFKISEDEMEQFLKEMKPVNRDSINFKAAGMGKNFVALSCIDDLASDEAVKGTLKSFFKLLKTVNAEFGYRSATEIYRFISQANKNDDTIDKLTANEILDCALVQKLLPKLHGSRKKLEPVLQALWKECFDTAQEKETISISLENVNKAKYPLTADKIQRMYEAAYANGFTSFAEA